MNSIWLKASIFAVVLLLFDGACCRDRDPVLKGGLLYPRESTSRERKDLNGIWNFRTSPQLDQDVGFREKWYRNPLQETGPTIPMPVPSSYNDITQDSAIQNFIGWVWYDYEFYVPERWRNVTNQRVVVHFGSAHYTAMVWLNGISVVNHTLGHLPFQGDVTSALKYSFINRITVALNSTLTQDTIPQGTVTYHNDPTRYPPGTFSVAYNFDFANYAGIHRPVYLFTTSTTYIDDITLNTDIMSDKTTGIIQYVIDYVSANENEDPKCYVEIYDRNRTMVAQKKGLKGSINIANATFWYPFQMHPTPGYLYTMKVRLVSSLGEDSYSQPFGIRTVRWNSTSFLINGKPFYFRGFGKHEDADIRGKGVDNPLIVKDFNLIKWTGANSFRTSHYPYADEILDRADVEGIVIIEESPACTLRGFGDELLANHKQAMAEMIRRDKNRPSVVMWSIGNEPDSANAKADAYFKAVTTYTRTLDTTRPLTIVVDADYKNDLAAQYADILCVNRYSGWYQDTGHLEVISLQIQTEFTNWHNKFKKPILISEYGADSIAGLHMDPPYVYTEDYQVALMIQSFKAFDKLRAAGFFVGEMIWNFADFLTPQETFRPTGCMKGVFTRQRNPKAAAYTLRMRYWNLAKGETNVTEIISEDCLNQQSWLHLQNPPK